MKTFKWSLSDDLGLDSVHPDYADVLRSRLDGWLNPESPFYVGDGPWRNEPDKAFWVDDATGLDCMIHRSPGMGVLCGYVGVPKGHPLYGCEDWDVIEEAVDPPRSINFSQGCDESAPEAFGICHVPEPGRPGDVWWVGFDCGHFRDLSPVQDAFMRRMDTVFRPVRTGNREVDDLADTMFREVYRDFDCVKGWVEELAAELAGCAVTMRRAGASRRSRHG